MSLTQLQAEAFGYRTFVFDSYWLWYLDHVQMEPGYDLVPVGEPTNYEWFSPSSKIWVRTASVTKLIEGSDCIHRRPCKHTNSCPLCPRRRGPEDVDLK